MLDQPINVLQGEPVDFFFFFFFWPKLVIRFSLYLLFSIIILINRYFSVVKYCKLCFCAIINISIVYVQK